MNVVGWRSVAVVVVAGLVARTSAGCVRHVPQEQGGWRLMQPPETSDPKAPKGTRLLPKAPIGEWHQVAAHPTEEACLAAKKQEIDREVKRARKELGDEDARFALPLRRAVSARCVHDESPH